MTWGFESLCPLAHQRCASSAVRTPRAGALPAASFPQRVTALQLPFGSGFLSSRSPEDLHLHVTSRFAFAFRLTAPVTALCAMPGAHKEKGRQSFDRRPLISGRASSAPTLLNRRYVARARPRARRSTPYPAPARARRRSAAAAPAAAAAR